MLYYSMGDGVNASSTNIGDPFDPDVVTPAHQGHTTNVAMIPEEADDTYNVDALVTNRRGIAVGVRTADCVPVLLYDPVCNAVAAVHSGWKGTAANIIACTLGRMRDLYGTKAAQVRALVGPCIHIEAFEVGDEVYQVFRENGYEAFARRMVNPYVADSTEKWHIDLPGICRSQLQACGVRQIEVRDECTYRDHDRFYSYRHCHVAERTHRIVTSIMLK